MSSTSVNSWKPEPHTGSHASRKELEHRGFSTFHTRRSNQPSVKPRATSTPPPSWSSTSLSTGTRTIVIPQTASERQCSARLSPIYSQTSAVTPLSPSQTKPHTLSRRESATQLAPLIAPEPTLTGGCKVRIPEQVNVRHETDLLDPGLLAAMWSSFEEQVDQAGEGVQGVAVTVADCSGRCVGVGSERAGEYLELYDGPYQPKEDSFELSASIAAHIAAAWEVRNGHPARRGIDPQF